MPLEFFAAPCGGYETALAPLNPILLDLCAAALDQDNQNNDKQHTRNNLDNRRTTHSFSLSYSNLRDSLPGLSGT
jgi:hypothetical protein